MNSTMTMPTQTRRCKSEKRLGPLHEPAAFVDGPNQYQYVGGDPVGAVDPEGLATTQPTTSPATAPARAPTVLPAGGRIPTREARLGWTFVGNTNFAGPGWSGKFMARPVDTWDFISKVHDLLYEVNGVTIWRWGNSQYRSRWAKADYIMRVLHKVQGSRSVYALPMRAAFKSSSWPGSLGRWCASLEFKKDDGFVNVLREQDLWEVPSTLIDGNPHSYLMIPYDALKQAERGSGPTTRKRFYTPGTSSGGRMPSSGSWSYQQAPDYLAERDMDRTQSWREWGRTEFGSLWGTAASVTAQIGSP